MTARYLHNLFRGDSNNTDEYNCDADVVDALVGKPNGCFTGTLDAEDLAILGKVAGLDKHLKWLLAHVRKTEGLNHAISEFRDGTLRALTQWLQKRHPQLVSSAAFPSDKAALRASVCSVHAMCGAPGHIQVGFTPHAIGEVRVLLKGAYHAAGLPYSQVEGATLTDKVGKLYTEAGAKKFHEDVKAGCGWAVTVETVGSVLAVPPGHLVVIASVPDEEADEGAEQDDGELLSSFDSISMAAHRARVTIQMFQNGRSIVKHIGSPSGIATMFPHLVLFSWHEGSRFLVGKVKMLTADFVACAGASSMHNRNRIWIASRQASVTRWQLTQIWQTLSILKCAISFQCGNLVRSSVHLVSICGF